MSPMIPLYRGHGAPLSYQELTRGHAGLWYDKFCNRWGGQEKEPWSLEAFKRRDQNVNPKLEWIQEVTTTLAGDRELLDEAAGRLEDLVDGLGGTVRRFKTEGRFVTGMGREHPVENGFAWHPTLGTPYLPGSSVKGAAKAWANHWAERDDQLVARIFGSPGQDSKDTGSIIFFDAIPWAPVRLEADVMTPHYAPYYQGQGCPPPADWHSPTPIPFLTVAAGQGFLFAVAPRRAADAADVPVVLQWLEEVLSCLGVGGKTAVGYGRFVLDQQAQAGAEKRREQQRLAEERQAALSVMSPLQREMVEDGYDKDPARFMQLLTTKWLNRLDAVDISGDDRREIARLLALWYQTHRPGDWEKPGGKNVAKVQRIRTALGE